MKNSTLKMALGISLLLFTGASVPAQKSVRCDLKATPYDTYPYGTNVHSGAGKTFPVVWKLNGREDEAVEVVGSRGSWVQIRYAEDENEATRKKYGWVFTSLLGMYVSADPSDQLSKGAQQLYAEAKRKSRSIAQVPAEVFVTLVGCDGKWARVTFQGKTGWLAP